MIKQFNIWYRKIVKRVKKGERFCLQGYITTSNVCMHVCVWMHATNEIKIRIGSHSWASKTLGEQVSIAARI